jgi:hypothetical protein
MQHLLLHPIDQDSNRFHPGIQVEFGVFLTADDFDRAQTAGLLAYLDRS